MADNLKLFEWSGINNKGQRLNGKLESGSTVEAQNELRNRGIEVISLESKQSQKSINLGKIFKRTKIKPKNILFFTRYLSTMLAAGLPIIQALDIIAHDKDNPDMQGLVESIKKNTSEGKSLAESFAQYPQYFSDLYCNLIKSGEKSGTLDKTLIRIATYLERTENLKRKVKKALVYPAAIMTVAFGVSLILLLFVVPKFESMFSSFGAELPFFTRMIVHLSEFLRSYWWIIAILIAGGIWGFKHSFKKSETLKILVDTWSLKIYIIGDVLKKSIIARFARTLATTLEAGMPMIEAMNSLSLIMNNRIYSKAILQINNDVISGHQLSESMKATNLFPHVAIQMIAVGEASGRLGDMLNHVANYYEEEVNALVDNLSSLLEPLIMIVLGLIVGSFVVAMYLPIFKIGSLF